MDKEDQQGNATVLKSLFTILELHLLQRIKISQVDYVFVTHIKWARTHGGLFSHYFVRVEFLLMQIKANFKAEESLYQLSLL